MEQLLEHMAIAGSEDLPGDGEETIRKEAREAVAKAQKLYELSTEEVASLSEEGESIERLQAILIKEHNDVSAASSPMTTIQIIKHMRAMLKKDEKKRGDEGMIMSEGRKLQLLEFTGYKSTRLYQMIKFGMLGDENYSLLMKVHECHVRHGLEGQAKKKKSKGDSEEDEGAKQMEFHGLEFLVASVDEQAIKNVFEELIECKRTLGSVKEFTSKWVRSNSKCLFCFTSGGVGYSYQTCVL
jgi:hypothetical protein